MSTTSQALSAPHPARLSLMSWAHFLNDGAANFLPGILPAILLGLSLPVKLAGPLMGALLVGQALQPFMGWLADHHGGRLFVLLGLAGSTLGAALVGWAPGFWPLVGILVLIGIANSMFHPQAMAGVRSLAVQRDGAAMSVFLVGGEIGRGLWPVLASWVVVHWGLHMLWILAIPGLLTLPVLWQATPQLAARNRHENPIQWRAHLSPFSRLVTYCALRALVIFSVVTFIPLVWHEKGGSLVEGASLIATMLVVGIIGNVGGGQLADRYGRQVVVRIASVAFALLLPAFLLSSGWMAYAVLGLLGIGLFSTLPLTVLIGQDIVPENRSLGSGIALGLGNALGAVGVMLLGPLAQAQGAEAPLWAAVVCGFIAIPFAFWLPKHG
ncbi:MAG: MFS transporter [Gammaproteobacteria bacterium]|jgi:FSR family fosmidomycin resistance protein-like MFS transporter